MFHLIQEIKNGSTIFRIRGKEDTGYSSIVQILVFSSVLNIFLDILFIVPFQMGVAGAASKADQVSVLVNNAMMTAISNYVAQNFGAGKRERIRQRSTTIPIRS